MNRPAARERAIEAFQRRFGRAPAVVIRGPGRVNVIGEHTDYNDGFVLPAAIDRELWIALEPGGESAVEAVSEAFDAPVRVRLDDFGERLDGWALYLQGVAWALAEAGVQLEGWRGTLASDVPVGAGLSSSAALELACARAFQALAGWDWDPVEVAHHCRRAENDWVGVSSGLMDQIASAAGRQGAALLLDCRSIDFEAVPVPDDVVLVVMDTATRRELASSGYNDRRRECHRAAQALGVDSLRDVSERELTERRDDLDEVVWRRAFHVVTENARTLEAAAAMRAGDPGELGRLMKASHRSLRDDFAVSSDALDAIVEVAAGIDGCYGARLTGGGFAGCAVALVAADRTSEFADELVSRYGGVTGHEATTHVCHPVDGASVGKVAGEGGATE